MIRAFGKTVVGRRHNNEDTIGVYPELGLVVVADGLGGYEGGEVASSNAVMAVWKYFDRLSKRDAHLGLAGESVSEEFVKHHMEMAVKAAQVAVLEAAVGDLRDMGTTVVIVWSVDGRVGVAHVGDSRAYRLRDGRLEPLTVDHSLVAEMRSTAGESVAKLLFGSAYGAAVTRSLGRSTVAIPDVRVDRTRRADRYLVCSDGLIAGLADVEIEEILSGSSLEEAVENLVDAAYESMSRDNISVVVAEIV